MARAPTFGGVPDRVRRGDWLLVQWVATAKPGDEFPEPWCHAHAPLDTMIGLLVDLGVIALPAPGTDVPTIAREATEAAQRWLEQHPEPELAPQSVPRRMTWGPPPSRAAAAASTAEARVAEGARAFVLRAEQLQLPMVVEHEYEVESRRSESSDAVTEYRRKPVRATAMWRLHAAPPGGSGAHGPDPTFDRHYVTRDREVRVSAARWDLAPGESELALRFAPTRPVDRLSPEVAELLVDRMAQTLVSPPRHEQMGELDGQGPGGMAAWLGPQGARLPGQDWTRSVLS